VDLWGLWLCGGQSGWGPRPLTDRKAWTMSALMLLRGLSFSTRNICSSLSKEMKFPNQERLASLSGRGQRRRVRKAPRDEPPLLPLLPSLLDSLWRRLWRQTGHLLSGGDCVGEEKTWSTLVHQPRGRQSPTPWSTDPCWIQYSPPSS
jgi:hypothetical protein